MNLRNKTEILTAFTKDQRLCFLRSYISSTEKIAYTIIMYWRKTKELKLTFLKQKYLKLDGI